MKLFVMLFFLAVISVLFFEALRWMQPDSRNWKPTKAMKAMSTDLLEYLPQGEGQTLLDDLLGEQQLLTPVARFSLKHDLGNLPAQAKYYRDLIPFSLPAAGQQYAFAVDLDACTGCKACVTACHSMNGLDEEETWRDVGVLFGGTLAEPVQQTVTTACHHCLDPACFSRLSVPTRRKLRLRSAQPSALQRSKSRFR
jgi:NAD-dependent dihydropyrimidine dehydrogenase PreA subunit